MKFDMLCNIVLEGKKSQQFARITVVNDSPTFSIDDILREPADPGKGVKSYIDEKPSDVDGQQDPERQARRALRRVNWVAKTAIRRAGHREIDIRKLHTILISIIEQYLSTVMRYSEERIKDMELSIAKEAALIGNLLLPPTDRFPKAKSVFAAVIDATGLPGENKKKDKMGPSTAERISKEFNMTVDEFIAAFDPDLLGTIKEIIRDGAIKKAPRAVEPDTDVESETPEEGSEEDEDTPDADALEARDEEDEMANESVDGAGVSVVDIMKDPRVKGVYDPRIVRKVIKSMLALGTVIQDQTGALTLPEPGTESWRDGYNKWQDRKAADAIEDSPDNEEIKELVPTSDEDEPTAGDLEEIEDEEGTKGEVYTDDEKAALRLGYKKKSANPVEKEEEIETPEEEEDGSWYK